MLKQLAYTSALASTLSIALIPQAQATNYVISGPSSTVYNLVTGDTFTVTSTGSIANPGYVYFSNTDRVGFITNNGTIDAGGNAAIVSQSTGSITGALTNTGIIRGSQAITFSGTGGDIGSGLNNSGTIQGITGDAIFLSGASGSITGGITNSGTIRGHGIGIHLESGYQVDNITNTNNITSDTLDGIFLTQSSSITGTITNNGTITAGRQGITVWNHSSVGNITNTGTITANGGSGIDLSLAHISGSITNSGTITSSGIGINAISATTIGSINNSGTITGSTGISLNSSSNSITGGITNSGTIRGTAGDGIIMGGVSTSVGALVNNGTIQGSVNGLSVQGEAELASITNNVNARIIGGTGAGVYVGLSSAIIQGALTNHGTISGQKGVFIGGGSQARITGINNTGTISGVSRGIDLQHGRIVGNLTNSGSITATAGNGITLYSSSISGAINNSGNITSSSVGIGAYSSSSIGSITNSGTITTQSDGIAVGNSTSVTGAVTNTGTISAQYGALHFIGGTIDSFSNSGTMTGSYGIVFTGGHITNAVNNSGTMRGSFGGILLSTSVTIGSLTNSGTIDGGSGDAVNVGSTSSILGSLTNSGTLTGSRGLVVCNTCSIGGAVNNSGTIRGTGSYGIYFGGSVASFTNSGTVQGTGGTAIYLDSLTTTLPITLNGGRVIGAITDTGPSGNHTPVTVSGNFTTEGNITVSSLTVGSGKNLTISSGNAVTLDHMGASTGGTFTFGVNNSSAGGYGTLVTNGAAQGLNLSGATVAVNYTGGAIHDGDQIRIGQGNAAITGGPGATLTDVTDNAILWNFKIANGTVASTPTTNRDLFLFVSRNNNVSYSSTANQSAVQNILNVGSSSDANFTSVINSVSSAPTTSALNQRAAATLPPQDGASYLIAQSSSATSFNQAGNRLTALASNNTSATGVASGDNPQGRHVWMEGFGQTATQGLRSGIAGYTASTGGVTFGADTDKLHPDAIVGVSVGFANTDARADNANATKTQISSNRLTFYGGYDLGDHYFARGMAAYAYDSVDTTRYAVGGVGGINASGSYHANQYAARAELGRDFAVNHITVTPALRTNYLYYDPNSYTETGAGGAGLRVSQKGLQTLEVGPSINVKKDYTLEDGSRLTPELRAGYQYAVVNDDISSVAAFSGGGGTISAPGATPADSRYSTGFGVTYTASDTWKFKADVDYQYRSDFHATSGLLRASYSF